MRSASLITLSITLLYSAVSVAAINLVSSSLFSRNDTPRDVFLSYDESRASGYRRQVVEFDSGGNRLRGYYYPGTSQKGLVVFAHGIDSCADSHLSEIGYFLDAGWSAFAFDGTGTSGSGGDGRVGLVQTKLDLEAALSYLESSGLSSGKQVCLYGHSMGGYAVAAALADGVDVAGVCCISAFDSPDEISSYAISTAIGPLSPVEAPFAWLHNRRLYGGAADITATDGINAQPDVPVLVVYGTEDEVVPASEVGIAAHKGKLGGANATFVEISEAYRNRHATAWLSKRAAELVEALGGQDASSLPLEERLAMAEVDEGFMAVVESFFSSSIGQ